ncbi:MAG: right-handed parallel beta-helix repeat-containing protein [Paludibacteraceae bacterium]|nr:right-handed parallel beta-helix repeat-containing protein [Paludibacteraceae bacterium]
MKKTIFTGILMTAFLAWQSLWAACPEVTGDTLYYTVGAGDNCGATVAAVITNLTGNATYYEAGALKTDVVILLSDTVGYEVSVSGFNANSAGKTLTIRSAASNRRATLTSLSVTGSKDVRVVNCNMQLSGATGLSLSNSQKIVLENNAIAVSLASATPATDAALNVLGCTNVQLLRNTLKGPHASLLQVSNSTQVLVMNNILWSDNTNANATYQTALVRFDGDAGAVGQIGVYYNTLYIAPGSNTTQKVDFFAMGRYGNASAYGHQANYQTSTIGIQYNNCLSYSTSVNGRTANAFVVRTDASTGTSDLLPGLSPRMRKNNYWSKYDAAQGNAASVFAPGTDADLFIAAPANLCAAAPVVPSDLVVSGTGFNSGYSLTRDHSGLTGLSKADDNIRSGNIRPTTTLDDASLLSGDIATIVLNVASSGATATHDIDLTGFHIGNGTTVTTSLVGTDAANFALSGTTSFTADGDGNVATGATTVTFTGPASQGEYDAAVRYTFSANNGDLTFDVPLLGVYAGSIKTGWTLGAYQQGLAIPNVTEIIWQGDINTDWDERANWVVASTGLPLTCADPLDGSYRAVIPAANSETYHVPVAGVSNYPVIPAYNDRSKEGGERVNTGDKFAGNIHVEYGAPLLGVENLGSHYDYATWEFLAGRKEWILVGTVVKPFESGTSGEVRMLQSRDFYLNALPQVYMREASIEDGAASWGKSFSSMYEDVDPTRVMAINVMDQYGQYKYPASLYYTRIDNNPGKTGDGATSKLYTFNGKFYNDNALPTYSDLTTGQPNLLNNTYPAPINLDNVSASGTFQVYDYGTKSFRTAAAGEKIKPQTGFVFTPSAGTTLSLAANAFEASSTAYRSSRLELPYVSVVAQNAAATASSVAGVRFNDQKPEGVDLTVDAPKVFNSMENTLPDIFVSQYDAKWARVDLPEEATVVPLGIRMQKTGMVSILAGSQYDMAEVVLEDRATGVNYDLAAGDIAEIADLEIGDNEGRFFLRLVPAYVVGGNGEGGLTMVEEAVASPKIYMFQQRNRITLSADEGEQLRTLWVSDMAGRVLTYDLQPQYDAVELPLSAGTYLLRVATALSVYNYKVIIK